ncbi:hypothetical protein FJC68_22565 [Escherichia coli]|nr:hypothetical protein [Escherichia coli]
MKKTAPDGAVSGMPAIRETGPGKNLQAITVSTGAPHPANHTHINNENYPSFSASSRRYWKIWRADFGGLFPSFSFFALRIRVRSC